MSEPRRQDNLLRRYVIAVSAVGPLLAVLTWLTLPSGSSPPSSAVAALFIGAAAVAERSALRLTYHTHISVATTIYVALIWMVPPGYAAAIAFTAALISEMSRYERGKPLITSEILFNAGQTAAYVSLGATYYVGMTAIPAVTLSTLSAAALLAVAGFLMHGLNTLLVATAGAIQAGVSPFRSWWQGASLDFKPHMLMIMFGATASIAVQSQPIVIPAILLPFVFTHLAIRRSIEIQHEQQRALARLVDIIELRDPYTAGHSHRVAETSRLIARALGLREEEADQIAIAGHVHDLGKVAIDPAVLQKAGKLDSSEQLHMEAHPIFGADALKNFTGFAHGCRLVRHHHERWDGAGYPDKLKGMEIPLGARILAVADTFDALTSDRPYRAGMSIERASRVLRDGAGIQWDPAVVGAFLTLVADAPELVPLFRTDPTAARSSAQAAA